MKITNDSWESIRHTSEIERERERGDGGHKRLE